MANEQQKNWDEQQKAMAKRVIDYDMFDTVEITRIGGLDISFDKVNPQTVCAMLVVTDPEGRPLWKDHVVTTITEPYVSGYLGFREVPVYQTLINRCPGNKRPDIIMVDGFGVLHHRGAGSATHIGLVCDIPTIGVGKTLLSLDGMNEYNIKLQFAEKCVKKGDHIMLVGETGTTYGAALHTGTKNPIYCSVGHRISLETAVAWCDKMSKFRIPEPIRIADIESKIPLKMISKTLVASGN